MDGIRRDGSICPGRREESGSYCHGRDHEAICNHELRLNQTSGSRYICAVAGRRKP